MAVKLNVGDYKRQEYQLVDPHQVIVEEALRGRTTPPSPERIVEMAESFLEQTQLQPVLCRKVEENRVKLNIGFTRMAAARLIRDGFVGTDGQHKQDPNFMLKIMTVNGNDEEAFIANIVENKVRNDTTPIDDATNMRMLSEKYGKTDADIARLYKCQQTKVGQYFKLLGLSQDLRDMVHNRNLSVSAALDLLDLPEDKRSEAVAAATKDNGKVNSTVLREEVREQVVTAVVTEQLGPGILNDADSPFAEQAAAARERKQAAEADVAYKPRTKKQLMDFLESQNGPATSEKIKLFIKSLTNYMNGKGTDQQLEKAFDKLDK